MAQSLSLSFNLLIFSGSNTKILAPVCRRRRRRRISCEICVLNGAQQEQLVGAYRRQVATRARWSPCSLREFEAARREQTEGV